MTITRTLHLSYFIETMLICTRIASDVIYIQARDV